jgi:dienelactone hydrolase
VVPELDDEVHLRDLLEGADLLGTPRAVLMGFCMGGMYCFKSARSDRFARIASFYGMITLPAGWRSPSQGEPLEYLRDGHPDRVWAVIGGKDHYTPSDDVGALRSVGVAVEFYPEAEHGFAHDASRPLHRADDAADAFAKAKKWLLD